MANLKIDDIINVVVSTASAVAPRDGFNVGLVLGKTVGTGMSAANRTIVVSGLDDMTEAGYASTDPEYLAASMYFGQTPRPSKLVVGLIVTDENYADALAACRASNSEWYACYIATATALSSAEITAAAAYVETIIASFFFEDATAADITSATTDIFSVLKGLGYKRTFGLYSATRYAGAAAMGIAMGSNDGTNNSSFTMAYKTLVGVTPDDLDMTQIGYLQGKNANYYVTRGLIYNVLENGVTASGDWYDEVIGLDGLAYNIQRNCMDLLTNTRTKIPYTDAGAMQFVLACNAACADAVRTGFLTPGVWKKAQVLDLEPGDTLTTGYLCQVEAVGAQDVSKKAQRICPPIYCCVNLSGAIHSATIKVDVQ